MRIVLVANNPKAPVDRIRPNDAVVQFNHCEHFVDLLRHKGPKVFVWRKNGDGSVSGWHGHEPIWNYSGDLHVVLGFDDRIWFECDRYKWPFRVFAMEPPRYPRGIPSTGFWAGYVMHRMGVDIALCGFTHGPAWPGHDWQFEEDWFDARGIARL